MVVRLCLVLILGGVTQVPAIALTPADEQALTNALVRFFTAPTNEQAVWKFETRFEQMLAKEEPSVRHLAWAAYRAAPIHESMKDDFDSKQVRFDRHLSAYTLKTVGTRPTNGWPLFIAMHGGGGTAKQVNDAEWKVMQRYYKDHAELGGYLYLALRAPNDTWNGFYDVYVYPLVANLIRQFLLFGDVDSNKVFLMGYSHGGYGAFAIGPKMPDRFAAIHASASAPTDGETTPKTLRNTPFTYMVGDKDWMHGRVDRCREFNDAIQKLRGDNTNIYPVVMQLKEGFGHPGLPDRDKIVEMYPQVRKAVPAELSWLMTDKVIHDFYWLRVENPRKKQEIQAACHDNVITLTTGTNVMSFSVLLDQRLADLKRPVTVNLNGRKTIRDLKPSLNTLCQTLARRGDPELAFTAQIDLRVAE